MTKKFVSMLLALVMCLSLAVPAFAAEERINCNYVFVKSYTAVDPDNYNADGHALEYIDHYECTICGDAMDLIEEIKYIPHIMQTTVYGTTIDGNGNTVTTYLHECRACYYNYISMYR